MKELTIYVAEDGTRFNTEEDCRNYERSLISVNAKFFDDNKKQISTTSNSLLDDACYIILNDVASLEIIDNLLDEESEPCISSSNIDWNELAYALEFAPQLIYWNESDWCWWNDQMAQLEDIVSGLNYEY